MTNLKYDFQTTESKEMFNEVQDIINGIDLEGGAKKSKKIIKSSKKGSKKSSKKGSKKISSKVSRMINTDMISPTSINTQMIEIENESLLDGGAKKKMISKKISKKGSKKGSKKTSKKGSKKGSKLSRVLEVNLNNDDNSDELMGGANKKKVSKKTSKKSSKKGSKMKRTLNEPLQHANDLKEKIIKELGVDRKYWFGFNQYFYQLRNEALETVKDSKDFQTLHKKLYELFERDLKTKGKDKISKIVITNTEEIKNKRSKK